MASGGESPVLHKRGTNAEDRGYRLPTRGAATLSTKNCDQRSKNIREYFNRGRDATPSIKKRFVVSCGLYIITAQVMSHVLYRKLNFRNIKLDSETVGETVGVVRKDQSLKLVRWGGFIRRETAKADHRAISVLLAISRSDGEDLAEGEYVQGCLIGMSVFAVIDSKVAIVKKTS